MKYVIDIDGTICSKTDGDYTKSEPFEDRIHLLNKLYDEGNTLVYFTARGMNTFNDDSIKANDKYYSFTKKQLDDWGVKYHSLVLGKPSADIYIDDKGISDYDFFIRIFEHFK
jgi:hypothetical protein